MSKNILETLTVKEVSIAERQSGVSFSSLGNSNAVGQFDLMQALAWVIGKRTNTAYTIDEAGNMTIQEMINFLGLDELEEETQNFELES